MAVITRQCPPPRVAGVRSGDDVGRSDRPRHAPLLRAGRRQTRRIRIGRCLTQKDDDAAVHAQLADMDVRLRHRSLQPAIRLRTSVYWMTSLSRAIVAVNVPVPVVDTEGDSS
jgi:hypothetical protein